MTSPMATPTEVGIETQISSASEGGRIWRKSRIIQEKGEIPIVRMWRKSESRDDSAAKRRKKTQETMKCFASRLSAARTFHWRRFFAAPAPFCGEISLAA
jgi:hypothetical protein